MTWAWLVTMVVEVCAGRWLQCSPSHNAERQAAIRDYERLLREDRGSDGFARVQQLHEWRVARIAELRRSMGVKSASR